MRLTSLCSKVKAVKIVEEKLKIGKF